MEEKLRTYQEMSKSAWSEYKANFKTYASISLLSSLGLFLLVILQSFATQNEVPLLALLFCMIVYIIGYSWGFTAMIYKISRKGENKTISQLFADAKPLIAPLFLTIFLTSLASGIAFIFLIIPGIIVSVWLSLSPYIVVEENQKGVAALKQSKSYITGHWWYAFLGYLYISAVVYIPLFLIGFILGFILPKEFASIAGNIISTIAVPIILIYGYYLYQELKRTHALSVTHTDLTSVSQAVPVRPTEIT